MKQKYRITVNTTNEKEPLGDLFGIFFEDINHAADGGLYAELIQNRAFEFSSIDNPTYNPMTAWEKVSDDGEVNLYVESSHSVSVKNPNYLVMEVTKSGDNVGVYNKGFNTGIPLTEKEKYLFSCYAKRDVDLEKPIVISLRSSRGEVYTSKEIYADTKWRKYELEFEAACTDYSGRLAVTVIGGGKVYLDFVSLFPEDTFKGRKNGMRKDLAQFLNDLQPKFMRFPGGCLVHDGSLNADDRNSMYRWKNTIGAIEDRASRRNNWGYNQTLGLGFYEYFLFCEDIGAKPLPVLPGAFNPHFPEGARAVPLNELQPWIDDALDLIEFANGDTSTVWGKKRAELGHEKPFALEYLAIGNEEIGEEFFERYTYIHEAIKEKYPEIKLINSAGPFAGGNEYEKGWKSARDNKSELVDEHYYQSPEWFFSYSHRYDSFTKDDPKVFLGEYASWGSRLFNALAEAAFMVMLERNAHAVALACYAPLFSNVGYTNWKPDLIWYDNHQVYGTANYYVQKLFMNHQGDYLLDITGEGFNSEPSVIKPVTGGISFSTENSTVEFSDIKLINDETGEERKYKAVSINKENKEAFLDSIDWANYTIEFKSKRAEHLGRFTLQFGIVDELTKHSWGVCEWDSVINQHQNGGAPLLSQSAYKVTNNKEYTFKLKVMNRHIEAFIEGMLLHNVDSKTFIIEPLYYTSSKDLKTGDIILKAVNASNESKVVTLDMKNMEHRNVKVYEIKNCDLEDINNFDNPTKIVPVERAFNISDSVFTYEFEKHSINVLRFVK